VLYLFLREGFSQIPGQVFVVIMRRMTNDRSQLFPLPADAYRREVVDGLDVSFRAARMFCTAVSNAVPSNRTEIIRFFLYRFVPGEKVFANQHIIFDQIDITCLGCESLLVKLKKVVGIPDVPMRIANNLLDAGELAAEVPYQAQRLGVPVLLVFRVALVAVYGNQNMLISSAVSFCQVL